MSASRVRTVVVAVRGWLLACWSDLASYPPDDGARDVGGPSTDAPGANDANDDGVWTAVDATDAIDAFARPPVPPTDAPTGVPRAGDVAGLADAAVSFEVSSRAQTAPVVLYNLGLAYRGLGRAVDAVDALDRYRAGPDPAATPDDLANVRAVCAALRCASTRGPRRRARACCGSNPARTSSRGARRASAASTAS